MNSNAAVILLFIFAGAFAGSVTLNIIQLSTTEDPMLGKARANIVAAVKDIRRTGTVTENNPSEGWFVVTSQTALGGPEKLKVWVVPGALIVRSQAHVDINGFVSEVEARPIEQKDLRLGEAVYVLVYNSSERKRLELGTAWAGQILPYSK